MKQRIYNLATLEIVHVWTIEDDDEEAFRRWCALCDRDESEYGHVEEESQEDA